MEVFGSTKHRDGALSSRFLRLVRDRSGLCPDFSDSFRRCVLRTSPRRFFQKWATRPTDLLSPGLYNYIAIASRGGVYPSFPRPLHTKREEGGVLKCWQ